MNRYSDTYKPVNDCKVAGSMPVLGIKALYPL